MSRIEVLKDVPRSELDEVVNDFKSEGAIVKKEKQENGLWKVTATFVDDET
jgi:hypothetical protein